MRRLYPLVLVAAIATAALISYLIFPDNPKMVNLDEGSQEASSAANVASRADERIPVEENISKTDAEVRAFTLSGTVEGDKSIARAWIKFKDDRKPAKALAIGEKIGKARLVYIGPGFVKLRKGSRVFRLDVAQGSESIGHARVGVNRLLSAVLQKYIPENELGDGGSKTKEIEHEELKRVLEDQAQLFTGLSVKPRLYKGQIKGYNITRLTPSHFFYKLGLRSGDVALSLNGFKLESTAILFELRKMLPTMKTVKLAIQRKDKMIRYNINIRD